MNSLMDFFLDPKLTGVESSLPDFGRKDHWTSAILIAPAAKAIAGKDLNKIFPKWPASILDPARAALAARKLKLKRGDHCVFDLPHGKRIAIAAVGESTRMFDLLTMARKTVAGALENKSQHLLIDLTALSPAVARHAAEAWTSAWGTVTFKMPCYRKEKKPTPPIPALTFVTDSKTKESIRKVVTASAEGAGATNLVRRLSVMAGNDLTPSRYVALALDLGRKAKLKTTFHDLHDLEKMGAGAFLAVSKASDDRGGGIVRLDWTPKGGKKKTPKLAVVGKGICFDTGGANLKTGAYMFGMNGDMAGSAVALATVLLAAKQQWPVQVSAYLAITDNMIGPKGFRPNDIVTSMSGKVIEVIDTDAEGRMILSDALHFASKDSPDLLLDFATLTGGCMRALGTSYSGVFSQSTRLHRPAVRAGVATGERVWPFPADRDYGDILKSDFGDFKQCRTGGGPDHIEAAWFLSQFIPRKQPWLHVDMSAIENDGGLAHVPTKQTGFGVRFAARMATMLADGEI